MERRFYVVPGFANAAYVIAVLLIALAALNAAFVPFAISGVVINVVLVLTAVLTAGLARFTKTTPIVVLREHELVLRAAMLAPERVIRFDALSGFSVADGYLAFVPKEGDPARLPMTSLTDQDCKALIVELESRVRRPSKRP